MSSANGDTEARLPALPSFQTTRLEVLPAAAVEPPLPLRATPFPTETSHNGECQAPALRNDAERLSAIIATQQEIATAGLDLQTVMNLIAQRTQKLTSATGAAVELAEGGELVYRAVSGTASHSLGLRLPADASLSGRCLRTGQALRCDDAEADDRVDRQACQKVGLRSMIVVPLLYDRRAVGVLKVLSPQPRAFSDRDVQTLQLMSGLLAAALSHAAAYEAKQALVEERTGALRQSEERLRLLWESAAVLLTTEEPDAMLRGLFTKLAPHFGLDTYFNYMVNDAGDALRLESCTGIPEETARSITRLEFGQAICGTVALHRQPVVAICIQHTDDPKAQLVKSLGIRAYACNPLLAGDRLIGTLSFASRTRDQFAADELEFLRTICHYVTVAYERLRLIHQLRQADRRKDEFLAVLAHELRNPLAPVRNAVEVMRLRDVDDPGLRWARDIIDRQVQQMTRLVDDLLDVSRITRGKVKLQKEPVDLAAVVARAVEISRPLIDARRHELTVTLPPEPVRVEADAIRLAQVVANLLNNAAKFTPEGGRIWLTVERDGGQTVVRVRDTGVGILAAMLPQVFDLFAQVESSLEHSQGGLGIGLTLAKSLVEMHGGSVTAHSDGPGQGSKFILRLPVLTEVRSADSGPGMNERLAESSARRILVVDDNVDAADSLALLLRLMGNDVRTAPDGPAALAAARAYRPDVVLLDLGLPRMSGYEVCRRLREGHFANGPLVVALTGYGQDEDRRRTREAGFDHHLVKPVNPDELRELLAEGHGSPNSPAFDPEWAGCGNRRSAHLLRAG
jgi:signal transduction histidine kinase/ActR/RegA family two-component response regulator